MKKTLQFNTILFISFGHVGDIVRLSPFLKVLRHAHPHACICTLMPPVQTELIKRASYVDECIIFSPKIVRDSFQPGVSLVDAVYHNAYSLIMTLKRMDFDCVINLYDDIGAIIAGVLKPKTMIGRMMSTWGTFSIHGKRAQVFYSYLHNHNTHRIYADKLFSESALSVLQDMHIDKIPVACQKPELTIHPLEIQFADRYLAQHLCDTNPYIIGIQSGSRAEVRCWGIDNFCALANRLQSKHNVVILFFGAPHEREAIESCASIHLKKKYINAAGETSIMQAAALMKKIDLLVSVDTGAIHIASALGTPVVGLYGRSTSIIREAIPYGSGHTVIVENNVKTIRIDTVYRAVVKHLSS